MDTISLKLAKWLVYQLRETPRAVVWTWDTIKAFGSSGALKTSYLFLFLVPIVARAISSIPETISVPIWGQSFEIALALPFSWILLFASACLASLGNIVYAIACPKIIKEFVDYPSFNEAQRDGTYLRRPVLELALAPTGASVKDQLKSVQNLYNDAPINLSSLEQSLDGIHRPQPAEFYFVRDAANLAKPLTRLLASLFYFAAFACLAVIALQNIYFVFEHLLYTRNVSG